MPSVDVNRFYDGAHIEKDILNRAYLRLIKHVNSIFKVRFFIVTLPRSAYLTSLIVSADPYSLRDGTLLNWAPSAPLILFRFKQIEDFIVKYMWSACGYCLISIPVFFAPRGARSLGEKQTAESGSDGHSVAQRTESESFCLFVTLPERANPSFSRSHRLHLEPSSAPLPRRRRRSFDV
jgi:ATP-binding cassette subfamily D (ALD) long-chain fatty acid import protein